MSRDVILGPCPASRVTENHKATVDVEPGAARGEQKEPALARGSMISLTTLPACLRLIPQAVTRPPAELCTVEPPDEGSP